MYAAGELFAAHLGSQFDAFDDDKSNELDSAELLLLFNSLQLRLSLQQIMKLRERMDDDGSGTISRDEFVSSAPRLIQSLHADQPAGPRDWCEISDGRHEQFFYNKRTGETDTTKPFEVEQDETSSDLRIDDYLARQFRHADEEARGYLEMAQFGPMMRDLAAKLAELLSEVGEAAETPADWAEIPTDDGRSCFWYNKRTQTCQQTIPQVVIDKLQEQEAEDRAKEAKDKEEAGAQDEESGEVLSDYLYLKFASAAQDLGGEFVAKHGGLKQLNRDQFLLVLKSTALHLSSDQMELVYARADNGNGAVSWVDFVSLAPAIVADLIANDTAGVDDWCELAYADDGPDVYWYNKRTKQSTRDIPKHVELELAQRKTPSVAAYLQAAFEGADADGSGQLNADEFSGLLLKMAFGLSEEQAKMLYVEMDSDGDGHISFDEFAASAPQLLKQVYSKVESTALGDWTLLPVSATYGLVPYTAFLNHCPELVKQVYAAEAVDFDTDCVCMSIDSRLVMEVTARKAAKKSTMGLMGGAHCPFVTLVVYHGRCSVLLRRDF
eukprot:g2547.t1